MVPQLQPGQLIDSSSLPALSLMSSSLGSSTIPIDPATGLAGNFGRALPVINPQTGTPYQSDQYSNSAAWASQLPRGLTHETRKRLLEIYGPAGEGPYYSPGRAPSVAGSDPDRDVLRRERMARKKDYRRLAKLSKRSYSVEEDLCDPMYGDALDPSDFNAVPRIQITGASGSEGRGGGSVIDFTSLDETTNPMGKPFNHFARQRRFRRNKATSEPDLRLDEADLAGSGMMSSWNHPDDPNAHLCIALYDYNPRHMSPNPDGVFEELTFRKGQLIKVYGDKDQDGFYRAEANGTFGLVPYNLVREMDPDEEYAYRRGRYGNTGYRQSSAMDPAYLRSQRNRTMFDDRTNMPGSSYYDWNQPGSMVSQDFRGLPSTASVAPGYPTLPNSGLDPTGRRRTARQRRWGQTKSHSMDAAYMDYDVDEQYFPPDVHPYYPDDPLRQPQGSAFRTGSAFANRNNPYSTTGFHGDVSQTGAYPMVSGASTMYPDPLQSGYARSASAYDAYGASTSGAYGRFGGQMQNPPISTNSTHPVANQYSTFGAMLPQQPLDDSGRLWRGRPIRRGAAGYPPTSIHNTGAAFPRSRTTEPPHRAGSSYYDSGYNDPYLPTRDDLMMDPSNRYGRDALSRGLADPYQPSTSRLPPTSAAYQGFQGPATSTAAMNQQQRGAGRVRRSFRKEGRAKLREMTRNSVGRRMVSMYDYNPQESSPNVDADTELQFRAGDHILVYGEMDEDGFYLGELHGRTGLVPSNFLIPPPDESSGHKPTPRHPRNQVNRVKILQEDHDIAIPEDETMKTFSGIVSETSSHINRATAPQLVQAPSTDSTGSIVSAILPREPQATCHVGSLPSRATIADNSLAERIHNESSMYHNNNEINRATGINSNKPGPSGDGNKLQKRNIQNKSNNKNTAKKKHNNLDNISTTSSKGGKKSQHSAKMLGNVGKQRSQDSGTFSKVLKKMRD